jgi:fructose-bisphosphate aldolase class II
MLANPKEILKDAEKNKYAIAGINATSLEAIMAVIEAAEELDAPVMLSHAQLHEPFAPIDVFGPLFVHFAMRAKVPVIIHLDHGLTMEYVMKAVRNGFTSIMYDCAHLPFEENVHNVVEFTKTAHNLGIIVEAEVGRMPSNVVGHGGCTEYGVAIENIRDYFTKPKEAAEFVKRTGVDMLTVSFGTVHGLFVEKPNLDIALLKKIKEVTDSALVMHGSTGVDDAQILDAISNGLSKINYYTGMGTAPVPSIAKSIEKAEIPLYFHDIAHEAKEIMKEKAKERILLFQNRQGR